MSNDFCDLCRSAVGELKALGKPPADCVEVLAAVAFVLGKAKKKVRRQGGDPRDGTSGQD